MLRARPEQRNFAARLRAVQLREEAQIMTRKAMPTRKPNSAYRSREHLLEREVEALIKAAKDNRHGLRDSTIILMMWRHGLRVSELCSLQWTDVDFEGATLNGFYQLDPGRNLGKTNPLNDDDLAEFVKLQKTFADSPKSWSVDAKSIDQTTFDLSVKNPNGREEVTHRSPEEIMDEIAALDAESAKVLGASGQCYEKGVADKITW
jgi:integrase